MQMLVVFVQRAAWQAELADSAGAEEGARRRKPTACPCERGADGECISSMLRRSASSLCSALLLALWLCQAGVYPSSARSCPDPLPHEAQLVGPSLKGLAPVVCNCRERLVPLLGLGAMVGSQTKELWRQGAECTCREDEHESERVFTEILKRQKSLSSVMQRKRDSKRGGEKDLDGDSTTSPGSLFQCLMTLSVNKFFLISNLNLPWCNLRPFPLVLSLVTWEKRPIPPLYTLLSGSCPSAAPHKTCAPDPSSASLPFSGHALAPQCLSCIEGPKTEHSIRGAASPGDNHCPSPAGHAISDTSQDAIGLLGHLHTLLAHIQVAVDQHPQVLFHQAAFQPLFPKPVVLHGVVVTQVQDPALSLVEPHTIGLGPSIQPVQVPLQSLPTLKQINTPAQLGVVCKLTEGALDPFVQTIDKDIKQDWPQY
ncbi:hypothetical protein QYF61_013111 [Mycteria americana]|uniref:Uncharacterized protein n=1 Tax=Mycteria americana TaxID=33587 RepID=A0AAN7MWN9_MYCAM|nr:hypothetical protein QYF61_013111 [Mycteria americana]